jgi:ankyrin repeat protein
MEELYNLLKAIKALLLEKLPSEIKKPLKKVEKIIEDSIIAPGSTMSLLTTYLNIKPRLENLNSYQDSEGNTSLPLVIAYDNVAIAKLLIHYKADINAQNNKRETPLHTAAYHGYIEAIELLTSLNGNLQIPALFHMTPFHYAVQGGHIEAAKKLIFLNGLNSAIKDEATPLHIAAYNNYMDIAEWLISEGAKIEARTINGETPLYLAAQKEHYHMCDYLISKGADINSPNNYGETLLYLAVQENKLELAHFFISKGANPNFSTKNGTSPLHITAQNSLNNIADFLLSLGVDVNAKTNEGTTPLHFAVIIGNYHLTCLLIKSGANVNAKTHNEETPLHFAIKRGLPNDSKKQHLQIALELIDKGAEIDSRGKKDFTPFLIAIKRGDTQMAQILIGKGANIYAETICEENAWDLADKNPQLIKLLDDTDNQSQNNHSTQEENNTTIHHPSIKYIKYFLPGDETLATLQSPQTPLSASPSKRQRN